MMDLTSKHLSFTAFRLDGQNFNILRLLKSAMLEATKEIGNWMKLAHHAKKHPRRVLIGVPKALGFPSSQAPAVLHTG